MVDESRAQRPRTSPSLHHRVESKLKRSWLIKSRILVRGGAFESPVSEYDPRILTGDEGTRSCTEFVYKKARLSLVSPSCDTRHSRLNRQSKAIIQTTLLTLLNNQSYITMQLSHLLVTVLALGVTAVPNPEAAADDLEIRDAAPEAAPEAAPFMEEDLFERDEPDADLYIRSRHHKHKCGKGAHYKHGSCRCKHKHYVYDAATKSCSKKHHV